MADWLGVDVADSIALFAVCAWPDCERTEIFVRGLCQRCSMRARRAGTFETYSAPSKICEQCCAEYADGTKAGKRFCSIKCQNDRRRAVKNAQRQLALAKRSCIECSGPIPLGMRSDAVRCSVACQQAAWYRANAERCRANAIDWNRAHPDRKRAASREWYARNPERARELSRAWRAANIELCRVLSRQQSQLRRARKYGVHYEYVTLAELWERDDGTCWLCDEPVDATLAWPHPMSVSMDHIIPLAKDGVHAAHNLAIAHLVCNLRKGAKLITKE